MCMPQWYTLITIPYTVDIDNLATNTEEVMEENISRCITNEQCWRNLDSGSRTMQFSCVRHAMDWINNKSPEGFHLQVLVCGSFRPMGQSRGACS